MKPSLPRIGSLLVSGLVVISILSGSFNKNEIVKAQTARQLPTRIQASSTPADMTIIGTPGFIAGAGDFNSDGVDDFLVKHQQGPTDFGVITFLKFGIIFGKRNQNNPVTINLSTQEPDLSLTTNVKGVFGNSEIAKLGDLNHDGIDDIVLTQQRPSVAGRPVGFVIKIFLGSKSLQPGVTDLDTLQPDLKITPDSRAVNTGIAGIADVNGDGARDLIVSEDVTTDSFTLPILFGPFAPGETIDLDSQKPDVRIRIDKRVPPTNNVMFADVNGDHIADILINTLRFDPFAGFFSMIEIVFGSQSLGSNVEISLSDGQGGATINTGIGAPVVTTGDINGDGFDDILMGTPSYGGEPAPPPWFSGSVSIVLGSSSMQGVINRRDIFIGGLLVPDQFQPIFPATFGDRLGESIKVSDVDGDGLSDILIGAPGVTNTKNAGQKYLSRGYVIVGSTEIDKSHNIFIHQDQQDITIGFDSETMNVGRQINSGDFNGDGVFDILVGSESTAYVFFGGQIRPPHITKAKYTKSSEKLSISGTDFTGSTRIEINGVVIDAQATFDVDSDKLILRGKKAELNLHGGKNQVVVIRKGARSNTAKLKL
jgi:hypothetical protein